MRRTGKGVLRPRMGTLVWASVGVASAKGAWAADTVVTRNLSGFDEWRVPLRRFSILLGRVVCALGHVLSIDGTILCITGKWGPERGGVDQRSAVLDYTELALRSSARIAEGLLPVKRRNRLPK